MGSRAISLVDIPGKPVAYNDRLFSINKGLLYGIVACCFGLLGVPGRILYSVLGLWALGSPEILTVAQSLPLWLNQTT